MPNQKQRESPLTGCHSKPTYPKKHCLKIHKMSEYMYSFFRLLCLFWHIELLFYTEGDYIVFKDVKTGTMLLTLRKLTATDESDDASEDIPISTDPCSSTSTPPSPRPVTPISTDPCCSTSTPPRPVTPGKQLESISPRKIAYAPTDIRYKLQKAGLYTTIREQDPYLIQFRENLHEAEGPILT